MTGRKDNADTLTLIVGQRIGPYARVILERLSGRAPDRYRIRCACRESGPRNICATEFRIVVELANLRRRKRSKSREIASPECGGRVVAAGRADGLRCHLSRDSLRLSAQDETTLLNR